MIIIHTYFCMTFFLFNTGAYSSVFSKPVGDGDPCRVVSTTTLGHDARHSCWGVPTNQSMESKNGQKDGILQQIQKP